MIPPDFWLQIFASGSVPYIFSSMVSPRISQLAFSQKRSQCILGLFGGTKNTVVDVKYVRIEIYTIKYQLFT